MNPLKRDWTAFAIVLAMLGIAAVALHVTIPSLKLSFKKLPVELSEPLISVRPVLGDWVQASVDRALNPDYEHELGTTVYIMRNYVNVSTLSPSEREMFMKASIEDREKLMGGNGPIKVEPKGLVKFALTYYTGSVDTVPHVPERCYAADGWKPSTYTLVHWPVLPREKISDSNAEIRMMNFEDQIGSRSFRPRQVCYFFQVNGEYEQDPIFGVRRKLQSLRQRYAYFAKIELVTDLAEPSQAEPVMEDFLRSAMPDIERVLPDWKKLDAESKTKLN